MRGHDDNNVTFKSGGGGERQAQVEYPHALFSSMESVLGGGGEGKEDSHSEDDGAGDNDSGSGRTRTGAGGIFGRVRLIYKLHGDVSHHKQASTLRAFSNRG